MPQRIQRRRVRGWRKPPNCRCVTRPGTFGNPFRSAKWYRWWLQTGVVHRSDLINQDISNERLAELRFKVLNMLVELRGLDLACYCKLADLCHADDLLKFANAVEGDPVVCYRCPACTQVIPSTELIKAARAEGEPVRWSCSKCGDTRMASDWTPFYQPESVDEPPAEPVQQRSLWDE